MVKKKEKRGRKEGRRKEGENMTAVSIITFCHYWQ
jgi:hypothetical protein